MGYYKPLPRRIQRGQRFGANPGWGPNPAGGHNGDDYLSQVGESVYAAGDGVVVFAGRFDSTYADNWGWNLNFGGQMVVLNLDGDTAPYVEYGHLSEVRVSAGDRVRAAQIIALTGADDGGTGVITGPHLHVGCLPPNFNLNTNTYGRVNPDLYLTDYPDETGTISVQGAVTVPAPASPTYTPNQQFFINLNIPIP
jgi:murein DD-endopeptidase MepM/ murein hydrolase activator NlpD